MLNWFFQISISILLMASFSKKAEANDDEPPIIDQDLPLVLIKTNQGLKLPLTLTVEKTGLFKNKKKIQFGYHDFSQQEFYCPIEDDKQRREIARAVDTQSKANSLKEKIDENCLMKKNKSKTRELVPQCQKEPYPKIMKMFVENRVPFIASNVALSSSTEIICGAWGAGKMLGFGYQVCYEHEPKGVEKIFKKAKVRPIKGTTKITFYNLCAAPNEILFTNHIIKGSALFYNNMLKKDTQKTWPIGTYSSMHIPHINFEQVKMLFEQVARSSNFRIQLLVDPDDYVMGLWKKPAYHYANVSLIHKDLQPCWNKIHEKIARYAIKPSRQFLDWGYAELFTGAFRLPATGALKIINHVQIPKIWVQIAVYVETYAVAIIANNYRELPVDNIITTSLNCKVNLCRRFIAQNFPNALGDIRCCALTNEIQALFGTTLKYTGVLEIDGVIVDEKNKSNNGSPKK